MQYTINSINGTELLVTFQNGQYANVRIKTESTLPEIDELVGAYTNEYVYEDTPNPLVSVGDVRDTIDPVAAEAARKAEQEANLIQGADVAEDQFNNISGDGLFGSSILLFFAALYFEREDHDSRLLAKISEIFKKMYIPEGYTADAAYNNLTNLYADILPDDYS